MVTPKEIILNYFDKQDRYNGLLIPTLKEKLFELLGFCPSHGLFKWPKIFRQNTAYQDESKNFDYGCKYCKIESDERWGEMWDEYYKGRG